MWFWCFLFEFWCPFNLSNNYVPPSILNNLETSVYSICHHFIGSIRVLISRRWKFLVKTILHAVFSFDPIFFVVLDDSSHSFAVFNKHRVHQFWDFAVLMFYEIKLSFFLVTMFYNHFDLWCVKKNIFTVIQDPPWSRDMKTVNRQ